jgi:hypothetical protein
MAFALVSGAHTAAGTTNQTTVTTPSIDTTGADLLVAAIGVYGDESNGSLSDSYGNTWHGLTTYGTGGQVSVRLYYCRGGTVGAGHTFSWGTWTVFPALAVAAFSGSATSLAFDAEAGSNTASPGSVTPAASGELMVSGLCWYPSGTVSIDSSFSTTDQVNYNGTTMGVALAYKIKSDAAAESPAWSHSGSFAQAASALAAFKAAAGGGGGVTVGADAMHYYREHIARGAA